MAGVGVDRTSRVKGGDIIFPENEDQAFNQKERIFLKEYPGIDFTEQDFKKYGTGFSN